MFKIAAMGSKNPDRIPLAARRRRCESVGQMQAAGWDVISRCRDCGLLMHVDLGLIIRVRGAHVSLWNRTARCRRIGCPGWVDFQARAPGMAWHEELKADDAAAPDEPPAWLRARSPPAGGR